MAATPDEYEKLRPSEENRAKLAPRPHPGARIFDPEARRKERDTP
jgi:hypothetical protein